MQIVSSKLLLISALLSVFILSCSQSDQGEVLTQVAQAGTVVAKVATEAPSALTQAAIIKETVKAGGEKVASKAAPLQETLLAILTKQALPIYTIDSDLTEVASVSGSELDNAIKAIRPDSPLIGLGQAIVRIGKQKRINAFYITAHAAWESSWGTSNLAREKNNLFGYGAYDSCPFECAWSFDTKEECLEEVMSKIKGDYLTEGGKYYQGHTLKGMNVNYATDPNWKNGIVKIMNALVAVLYSG